MKLREFIDHLKRLDPTEDHEVYLLYEIGMPYPIKDFHFEWDNMEWIKDENKKLAPGIVISI